MRWVLCLAALLGVAASVLPGGTIPLAAEPLRIQPVTVLQDEVAAQQDRAPVISAVAIDPSGTLVATGGDDHLIRVWDARSLRLVHRLEGHTDWVTTAVFLAGDKRLVTGGQDGRLIVWELDRLGASDRPGSGKLICRIQDGIRALAVSPDGGVLAAGSFSGTIRVYKTDSFEAVTSLAGPSRDVRAIAFSLDGKLLCAGGRDGRIRLWNTHSWQPEADLTAHHRRVRALAFRPDGKQLASAAEDRKLILWDPAERRPVAVLDQPAVIVSLCWCGSDRLYAGGTDNVIRILRLPEGAEVGRLVGHTGTVTGIICRPDGSQILSVSYDTTIRVWSAEVRESVAFLPR